MGAVGHSSDGGYDEANTLIDEAHELAKQTASPTDLASVAVARGFASQNRGRGAWRRSPLAAGSPAVSATAGCTGSLSPRRAGYSSLEVSSRPGVQDWRTWSEYGTAPETGPSSGTRLSRCVIALDRIGQAELAMELLGAIETHAMLGVAPMSGTLQDLVFATRSQLLDSMGAERTDELLAVGATCPVEDIVFRTRRALIGAS